MFRLARSGGAAAAALALALALAPLVAGAVTAGCGPTYVARTDSSADAAPPGTDATVPPTDAGPPGPPAFALAAWNIEQFPMTPTTIDSVVELLLAMDVQLVGVEEIADTAAFETLVSRLPGWDGIYAAEGDGFFRVGMLWRTDRVQVSGIELLFETDSWAFPRPVLKADIVASEPGVPGAFDFTFLVVHLKAQTDAESRERRRLAVIALEQYLGTELSAGLEDDFVIAGDWNDQLTDAPLDNVFLPFIDNPEAYTFLTLPLEQAGGATYIPFDSFLDHVLVTAGALDEYGAGGTTEVLELDAAFFGYVSTVSDHRPVRTTFAMPY